MYYNRPIFAELSKHATQKQVTLLTGLRRTGKSTLVKQLLKTHFPTNSYYFDLERLDNRNLFNEANYENIILALTQRGINFNMISFLYPFIRLKNICNFLNSPD